MIKCKIWGCPELLGSILHPAQMTLYTDAFIIILHARKAFFFFFTSTDARR